MNLAVHASPVDLSLRVASILPSREGQFWGGGWHDRPGAERLASINPSTGEVLAATRPAQAIVAEGELARGVEGEGARLRQAMWCEPSAAAPGRPSCY